MPALRYFLPVQEEEELAGEVAVGDAAGPQAAARERVLEGDAREAAHAQAGLHRALDGLGVLEREGDLQRGEQAPHGAVEGLAVPSPAPARSRPPCAGRRR
jgi:hypothetical protein